VEISNAFGPTKPKLLAVVTDKDHAVARVAWTTAEITLFNPHGDWSFWRVYSLVEQGSRNERTNETSGAEHGKFRAKNKLSLRRRSETPSTAESSIQKSDNV
jgi:hypothetical protein